MMREALGLLLALLPGLLLALGCEGDGDGGNGLVIRSQPLAPNCATAAAGSFPSGLTLLSEQLAQAALVQVSPPGIATYDVDAERPIRLAFQNIGTDSDSDGRDDATAIAPIVGFPLPPFMGSIQAPSDEIALVSTSNYEQVLAFDPATARPVEVTIDVPPAIPAERYPLLPPPGSAAPRTGLSTLACVQPPIPEDSDGNPIGIEPACDPVIPSFLTTLSEGKAVAGDRLFVATSNLLRGSVFRPGTVLVFDWLEAAGTLTLKPAVDVPMLFTTGFNPTGVEAFETPGGRELVLVTVTGAIGSGSGASNVLSEAAVDVIDPSVPRIVATIPLGFAGPSFDAPAIEPAGRLAWLGASSQRQLYAVDLRLLDDPRLYAESGPPVVLDGLSLGFGDARIFTADHPLVLPARADRRASSSCEGFTHVTTNFAGTEVYATDFCDGTLTRVRQDLAGNAPIPYPADRFQIAWQSSPFAPNDAIGELRAPSLVAARHGIPGIDFTTPDVLTLVGLPEAQLCSLRVESP
jgi:hypothetical protein